MFALSVYMHKHHNRFGILARDISSVKIIVEIMDYHDPTAPFSLKNHREVKHWSAKLQGKKGDCLLEGFVSELPSAVYPKFYEIKKMKLCSTALYLGLKPLLGQVRSVSQIMHEHYGTG